MCVLTRKDHSSVVLISGVEVGGGVTFCDFLVGCVKGNGDLRYFSVLMLIFLTNTKNTCLLLY